MELETNPNLQKDEESLENPFICPICLQILFNPITFFCGHNFCQSCIRNDYFYSKKQSCPICRAIINHPLKHFKVNLLLHSCIMKSFYTNPEILSDRLRKLELFAPTKDPNSSVKKTPRAIRILKKIYKFFRRILQILYKMIPGLTLFLAFVMFIKMRKHSSDNHKLDKKYTEEIKNIFSSIRNKEIHLNNKDVDMNTLVFSKLVKYLFTNYIKIAMPH